MIIVNIYSHVIGAAIFFALPVYLVKTEIPPRYLIAIAADKVVCLIYCLGVAICFCLSALSAIQHARTSMLADATFTDITPS